MEILAPVVFVARKVRAAAAKMYHRLAGHVYVVVSNGDERLYAGWAGEFHIAEFYYGVKEVHIYETDPDNGKQVFYKFTGVVIGDFYAGK